MNRTKLMRWGFFVTLYKIRKLNNISLVKLEMIMLYLVWGMIHSVKGVLCTHIQSNAGISEFI